MSTVYRAPILPAPVSLSVCLLGVFDNKKFVLLVAVQEIWYGCRHKCCRTMPVPAGYGEPAGVRLRLGDWA